jgi:hypothetical protein
MANRLTELRKQHATLLVNLEALRRPGRYESVFPLDKLSEAQVLIKQMQQIERDLDVLGRSAGPRRKTTIRSHAL